MYGTEVHEGVVESMRKLAQATVNDGNLDQAKEIMEKIIDIQQKIYGTEICNEVALSMGSLASILVSSKQSKEAIEALKRLLRIKRSLYGTDEHIEIVSILQMIGLEKGLDGDLQGKKSYYEQALNLLIKTYQTEKNVLVSTLFI